MKRIEPTYRQDSTREELTEDYLDDLFASLFDSDDLSSDYDRIPNIDPLD